MGARATSVVLAGLTALIAAACSTAASQEEQDWPSWHHDLSGSRHNPGEERLTQDTVGKLKLQWAFGYDKDAGPPLSQPAVVGDTVYFGSPEGKVHARDAKTGAARWEFALRSVEKGMPDSVVDHYGARFNPVVVSSGIAVATGRVYFGGGQARLFALDQKTGKRLWQRRLDTSRTATLTSTPVAYGGRVYVGVSSGENTLGKKHPCCRFRGHVDALDAATGKLVWRHYTTPEPRRDGSWPNGKDKFAPSGAGVWGTPAIDGGTRTLYVGTGQNYTGSAGEYDSVLALDIDTGKPRWTRRMTDVDTWRSECSATTAADRAYCPNAKSGTALDFDLGAAPNLFSAGGRKLMAIGQKSGVFHVLDAKSGKIVWQRQLSEPPKGFPLAGIQWGSSYDGKRLYAATYMAGPGTLFALDPATGHVHWKRPAPADGCKTGGAAAYPKICVPGFTPAVTTTPGLVWEGAIDGKMRAYAADSGKPLWTYDTMRPLRTVNGLPARGGALAGRGGAVVAGGQVYVQAGYPFSPYPNPGRGSALLVFGLE
ncbi:PQQ-binding-like beta-propeller repeat protein [Streptomyces boninensis]|uniref:outer membrane protein assembly factor BamB family protein n=1 Tax=Streptomyces boninensis TaxID=2039455 RepID=UPI003B21137C